MRVLVTHADEPIGRRVVKTCFHDPEVESIFAVGSGPAPRAFDGFLATTPGRLRYARADLAKHRPVADLFHSSRFREARIDAVVHVPHHSAAPRDLAPLVSGVHPRTAEARLVLQHCLEQREIRALVVIGSAFVYRPVPGNANRMRETSALDLDPDVDPEVRAWIDSDMIFHGEIHHERLRLSLLRVPTVVASGGFVYLNPGLAGPRGVRVRPLGFDPLCALVSDKDVAKAVLTALRAGRSGVYNVAGREALPLSVLARWTRRPSLPVPGPILRVVGRGAGWIGRRGMRHQLDGAYLRYGFTLDTTRAEQELGFRPGYRIGLSPAGDGSPRLETSPANG
jgi:UDP-glucose 4-epimerase